MKVHIWLIVSNRVEQVVGGTLDLSFNTGRQPQDILTLREVREDREWVINDRQSGATQARRSTNYMTYSKSARTHSCLYSSLSSVICNQSSVEEYRTRTVNCIIATFRRSYCINISRSTTNDCTKCYRRLRTMRVRECLATRRRTVKSLSQLNKIYQSE